MTPLLEACGVTAVVLADGGFPRIADPAAPFIHARIMGTTEDEPAGYPPSALDLWAERARIWARGGTPEGFGPPEPGPSAKAPPAPRDVFLYVIGGHKERNPQAAAALIERLRT